jgi:hypothetical protein
MKRSSGGAGKNKALPGQKSPGLILADRVEQYLDRSGGKSRLRQAVALYSSRARASSARNAAVACTLNMAFRAALPSALTASACNDRNSIHSIAPGLVMKR